MNWDVCVISGDWFWKLAWFFKIKDNMVIAVMEDPYNPHARGTRKEMEIQGVQIDIWENQRLEVWEVEEMFHFLEESLRDAETEVFVWEGAPPQVIEMVVRGGGSTTSYID